MSTPTWMNEEQCKAQQIYWHTDHKGRPVKRFNKAPAEWQELIFTMLNQANKHCFALCVKHLPPSQFPYLIDLFLAETVKSLKNKIEYFVNEQKENVDYDAFVVFQGNKAAKNLYSRSLGKSSFGNMDGHKYEACKKYKHSIGLPNYDTIIAPCLNYRGKQEMKKCEWKQSKCNYKVNHWKNVSYYEFGGQFNKTHEKGDVVHCMDLAVVVLSLPLKGYKDDPLFHYLSFEEAPTQNVKSRLLYQESDFKENDINVHPIIHMFVDLQQKTV